MCCEAMGEVWVESLISDMCFIRSVCCEETSQPGTKKVNWGNCWEEMFEVREVPSLDLRSASLTLSHYGGKKIIICKVS